MARSLSDQDIARIVRRGETLMAAADSLEAKVELTFIMSAIAAAAGIKNDQLRASSIKRLEARLTRASKAQQK